MKFFLFEKIAEYDSRNHPRNQGLSPAGVVGGAMGGAAGGTAGLLGGAIHHTLQGNEGYGYSDDIMKVIRDLPDFHGASSIFSMGPEAGQFHLGDVPWERFEREFSEKEVPIAQRRMGTGAMLGLGLGGLGGYYLLKGLSGDNR